MGAGAGGKGGNGEAVGALHAMLMASSRSRNPRRMLLQREDCKLC